MHPTKPRNLQPIDAERAAQFTVPPDTDPRPAPILAVTVADASRISGLGRTTIYERMADGSLPFAKIGRRTVIPMDGLIALIASGIVRMDEAAANERQP
jgi:excisionase family DNA binding protein